MRNFTDELVDLIIENEKPRIDKIMNEVTEKISQDFELVVLRFLDLYYENYDPTSYVRVYGRRGKHMSGRTPEIGQVSLHAAISRNKNKLKKSGGTLKTGVDQVSYIGGIEFDEANFKKNSMRHFHKGNDFSEWNIVENFIYAGDGVGKGDWRSEIDYNYPSFNEVMIEYMNNYGPMFDRHYKNALKKFS